MKLNKILIIGSVGSGKTTLAKKLSELKKIKYYTMGELVYKKYPTEKFTLKETNKKLKDILNNNKWIIEGVYFTDWILPAYKSSDFVIILDLNKLKLSNQVIKRAISNSFKGDYNSLKTLKRQFKFIFSYSKKNSENHKNIVSQFKKPHIIFKNNKQINNFLKSLK